MNRMDWDSFRFFLAAAEEGSLTAAAKKLGSNQPTVGRQIDALESSLGVKLFQRTVKGLRLTEEGVYILEQTQSMQSAVLNIERAIEGEKEEVSGTVRVALPEGICVEMLTPLLPEFYNAYPNIKLILNVSSNSANLTRGEADIAVRLYRPKEVNLVAKCLGHMSMGLFASAAYLKTYGYPSTKQDLKNHRVITYDDQLSLLPENQWLVDNSESLLRVLCSDNTITRLQATIAGVGISIQPKIFCQMNVKLKAILEGVMLPSHEVWMVYHNDLRDLSRIRAVVNFISSKINIE